MDAPTIFNFFITSSTRISGADAPAVNPIFSFPSSHSSLISVASSIKYAGTPAF